MQRVTRSLIAVIAGLAVLLLPVAPSGASTGTLNGGHMGLSLTPATTTDLVPGTGPCPTQPPSLAFGAASSVGGGVHVTLTFTHLIPYGGAGYFLTGLSGHGTGSLDPTTTAFTVGPFTSTTGNIYAETSPGSCTPGVAICSGIRLSTSTGPLNLHGSFPGGHAVSVPDVTGTAVMSGTVRILALGCVAPFAAWNGKTMTFTNLNVTFV